MCFFKILLCVSVGFTYAVERYAWEISPDAGKRVTRVEVEVYTSATFPTVLPTCPPPTFTPTGAPFGIPSPSLAPTYSPSLVPTQYPTLSPTFTPSTTPSTAIPSNSPTIHPSRSPTLTPSVSLQPTYSQAPSFNPSTRMPTAVPTTRAPTLHPVTIPPSTVKPTATPPTSTSAPTIAQHWSSCGPQELWTAVTSGSSSQFLVGSYKGSDTNKNELGGIYISKNGCDSWELTTALPLNWYRVTSSSSGKYLVAAVDDGFLYYSSNSGANWQQALCAPNATWSSIKCSSSTGQYCVATVADQSTTPFYSNNYGVTWYASSWPPSTNYWSDVAISSTGSVAYATIDFYRTNQIYKSMDSGATWQPLTVVKNSWYSVTCDSTGQYAVAASDHGLFYSDNYGRNWTLANGTTYGDWFGLTSDSSGQYVAVIEGSGYIYLSDDYGVSWLNSTASRGAYTSITYNEDGSQLTASVYNSSMRMGSFSGRASSSSSTTDDLSSVGGPGGLFGILFACVLVVAAGVIGVLFWKGMIFQKSDTATSRLTVEQSSAPALQMPEVNKKPWYRGGGL
jgi:hypothetical protein